MNGFRRCPVIDGPTGVHCTRERDHPNAHIGYQEGYGIVRFSRCVHRVDWINVRWDSTEDESYMTLTCRCGKQWEGREPERSNA